MYKLVLAVLLVTATTSAAELADVPARMAVASERMTVRKLYDRSADKADAARSLADQAVTAETSLRRYAMLDEARRLAKAAKDVELMLQIVDVTGQYFNISVPKEKLGILKKQRVRTIEDQRKLLDHVVALADVAAKLNDYGTVTAALKTAKTMASRVKDKELVKSLATRAARNAVLVREWAKISKSIKTLKTSPDNPDANLQLGLFLCVFRKEWPTGLRLMAKGAERFPEPALVLTTDATCKLPSKRDERILEMAKIARVDLTHPTDAATCAQLGDSWVAISKLYTGESRNFFLLRAGRWYAKAIAALPDNDRPALKQRVSQIKNIGWYGVSGGGLKTEHFYGRDCESTVTRSWKTSPSPSTPHPVSELWGVHYSFRIGPGTQHRFQFGPFDQYDRITKYNRRPRRPHWKGGSWVFDAGKQEVSFMAPNSYDVMKSPSGLITKVFSVGLKNGRLFLYNCRDGGVETDETALEIAGSYKRGPIKLAR